MDLQSDLIFELGVEELPSQSVNSLAAELGVLFGEYLTKEGLSHEAVETYATPRRLAVLVKKLIQVKPGKTIETRGPKLDLAYDKDGNPTEALIRFAENCGTAIDKLERHVSDKGTWLKCSITKKAVKAAELLPEIIKDVLEKLHLPRTMRWGMGDYSFIRPVHWVLLVHGDQPIPGKFFGVEASNKTYGHRFHHPDALVINEASQYEKVLEEKGKVIPNFQKRKDLILEKCKEVSTDLGRPLTHDDLLNEVAGLLEWPVVLAGKFESRFLSLPREVLILVLQKQERCFPIVDEKNKLQADFLLVSNIESKKPEQVVLGYEKVIAARLTDADFFYHQDLQFELKSYEDKVKATIFQKDLGSLHDKVLRMNDLAIIISGKIGARGMDVMRAVELAKADLKTTMVGEFPELEGIMGYYYALAQNETEKVALAIKEQYLPRFADDVLPQTLEGAAISLADRIDTLAGIFCTDKIPTGEKDPFGLRRIAFGIIRIVLTKKIDLDLRSLIHFSLNNYRKQQAGFDTVIIKNYEVPSEEFKTRVEEILTTITEHAMDFVYERLRSYFNKHTVTHDVFAAVLAKRPGNLLDFELRALAVNNFKKLPEAEALIGAHKRVNNILRKAIFNPKEDPKPRRFEEQIEKELYQEILIHAEETEKLCRARKYEEALKNFAGLKRVVDFFFDQVMVMVDDKKVRNNRLLLLNKLHLLFSQVADISLLQ
jgi:glycyl-tRNA synthetase beta chain